MPAPRALASRPLSSSQRELVAQNLNLARWAARRFGRATPTDGPEYEDAVAAATLGLVVAAGRYDPEYGTTFSSYALFWCRAGLNRWRQDQVRQGFRGVVGRPRVHSLDTPSAPDESPMGLGLPAPAWDPGRRLHFDDAAAAVSRLDARTREAVRLLYEDGLTLQQAGNRLGMTKERVRQIREAALTLLRRRLSR